MKLGSDGVEAKGAGDAEGAGAGVLEDSAKALASVALDEESESLFFCGLDEVGEIEAIAGGREGAGLDAIDEDDGGLFEELAAEEEAGGGPIGGSLHGALEPDGGEITGGLAGDFHGFPGVGGGGWGVFGGGFLHLPFAVEIEGARSLCGRESGGSEGEKEGDE